MNLSGTDPSHNPVGSEDVGGEVLERLADLVRNKTTDMAPTMLQVPLAHYHDPARHQRELDEVFRSSTLCAAPTAALPNPGDYLTRDVLDKSLLVTRDGEGTAHVLLNYCTHRGAIIACDSGTARRHTCPYHGWTFEPDGTLVGIPGSEGFAELEREQAALVELPSEEAYGVIWYTLDPEGTVDVEAHLGPMAAEMARWSYEGFWLAADMDLEFPANWKSTAEAFSETYHFPYVHQSSIGPGVVGNTAAYDQFGRHHRVAAALASISAYADGTVEADPNMQVSVLYYVYPDLMLANTPFGVEFIEITPGLTPDHTRLRHYMTTKSPPANDEERAIAAAFSTPAADAIRLEDGPQLATCGRGLTEGAHGVATLGRNEPGCQNIHNQTADLLGER